MCCIKENNTKIQFVFVFSLFVFGRAITWHPSQEVHVYVWEGVCVQCHLCMYACFVYMSMHLELLILCLYICIDCEQKKNFWLGLPWAENKVWFDLTELQTILNCYCLCPDLCVFSGYWLIILTFDRDYKLGNYRQNFWTTMLQHIMHPLTSKELPRMLCFTKAIKEKRKIVMIVKLLNLHLQSKNQSMSECFV